MSNPSSVSYGNIKGQWILAITISPSSVAPNTTAEQTFTVGGLQLGDMVDINKPTHQGGLGITNSRVSAANTLAVGFVNATAATISPTANEIYYITVTRPDNLTAAANSSMASIVS